MKRSHIQLLFALVFTASLATAVINADAGQIRKTGDDIVNVLGDDGGVAPTQGEPDVGQTNGDPTNAEPGIGDLRWAANAEGLLTWTSAIWIARLFGIGI